VGAGQVKLVEVAAVQVVADDTQLDGHVTFVSEIFPHTNLDLFPAQFLRGTETLVAADDGPVGKGFNRLLLPGDATVLHQPPECLVVEVAEEGCLARVGLQTVERPACNAFIHGEGAPFAQDAFSLACRDLAQAAARSAPGPPGRPAKPSLSCRRCRG